MGLFQKKSQFMSVNQSLYEIGNIETLLIVGLGNTGDKYTNTRHNIGFMCVDEFHRVHEFEPWANKKSLQCDISSKILGKTKVVLIKPTTMMNLSGIAAQKVRNFYKIPNDKMLVVYDELDLPFGQIRTRVGGSDAGHNGVKSMIEHNGSEFGRVRVGIMPDNEPKTDSAKYVLNQFNADQKPNLKAIIKETTSILTECVYKSEITAETRSVL